MYDWRKMTDKQREDAVRYRRVRRFPKHSPPHFDFVGETQYLLTAACYEHQPVIGRSAERLGAMEAEILSVCEKYCQSVYAWCILPNHYHVFLKTDMMAELRAAIGKIHGRTSFKWNGEDAARGRQVWHNCFEKKIKGSGHFYATLNYVLNNPVHHGLVDRWQDWPWSSAKDYLENTGRIEAERIWKEYPILGYGKGWDD